MICRRPGCGREMVRREGKFGPFLACPASYRGDNHGTVSLREEARDYERRLAQPKGYLDIDCRWCWDKGCQHCRPQPKLKLPEGWTDEETGDRHVYYDRMGQVEHVVYHPDGSGYLDCGGPCGPLYFDQNGDT